MEIINLDMVPGKKSPVCHASQYDDGRVIRFNLYDSGLPYTLDGTETITFEVRKPDGNIVTSTLTNTSDSYVDVVTTEQMTAVKGANLCEVRVEKGATNIGSLNVIMAVEMDPTDGGIASASEIDNLRSQVSGMVAEEVAEQYDAGSVIFDSAPTPGHGNGYAVTSEGIATALGNKADRSELPDMTNYYDKTETDELLDDKADVSDLPDMSNYYTKSETDTALDGKADKTQLPNYITQPSGQTAQFRTIGTFFYYYADQWNAHIPFQFVTKNTNYTITLNEVIAENVGDITNKCSVIGKASTYFDIQTTRTMTALPNSFSTCVCRCLFTIQWS